MALPCSVLENAVFLKLMSSLAPLLDMPAAYIYYLDNVRTIGRRYSHMTGRCPYQNVVKFEHYLYFGLESDLELAGWWYIGRFADYSISYP